MHEGFKSLLLHNVKIRMNTGKFSVHADFCYFGNANTHRYCVIYADNINPEVVKK